jgi:hypothetical protein
VPPAPAGTLTRQRRGSPTANSRPTCTLRGPGRAWLASGGWPRRCASGPATPTQRPAARGAATLRPNRPTGSATASPRTTSTTAGAPTGSAPTTSRHKPPASPHRRYPQARRWAWSARSARLEDPADKITWADNHRTRLRRSWVIPHWLSVVGFKRPPIHRGRWSPITTDATAVIDSAAHSWRSGTESALERGANAQALLGARGRPAGIPHGSRRDCLAWCRLVSAETGRTPIAPLVVR